jgi:chemotaxis-related protein WspD
MNSKALPTATVEPADLDDCWNRIGVRGDGSCAELAAHIHCRNCPVYSAAARKLLDTSASSDYSRVWTDQIAQPIVAREADSQSVMIFRVGAEWMAVPMHLCVEVANSRAVHSLPHRRSGAVLGLSTIRGVLLVCVSLSAILQVTADEATQAAERASTLQRLLVLRWPDGTVAVLVDEVYGPHRFQERDLKHVPATVGAGQSTYTKAVLSWGERSVGLLDEQLLGYTVTRSLA